MVPLLVNLEELRLVVVGTIWPSNSSLAVYLLMRAEGRRVAGYYSGIGKMARSKNSKSTNVMTLCKKKSSSQGDFSFPTVCNSGPVDMILECVRCGNPGSQ